MHNSTISHTSCLHHFRHQMPPKNIIVVGAGAGSWANLLSEWEVGNAHFVEADKNQIQHLRSKLAKHATWQAHTAVMWHESAEISFYQAANPAENSSLPPDTLANLWPNFKTLGQEQRQTTTLNHLINEIQAETPPNWLIVDCLPALNIIQGAGAWLNHCEVIIARVLLSDKGFTGLNTSKEELDTYLNSQGFHFVSIQEERHPNIGNALYVRNVEQVIQYPSQALEAEQNPDNNDQQVLASNTATTALKAQLEIANISAAEFKQQLEITQLATTTADKALLENKAQLDAANLAKATQQELAEEHQAKLLEQNSQLETINASEAELKQQLASAQQATTAADKALLDNKAQLDAANLAKAAQQKLAEERQTKLLEQNTLLETINASAAELKQQLANTQQAKTAVDKTLLDNKAQLDAANLAKAAQQKLAEERQAKLLEQNIQLETINASASELKQQLANTKQAKAAVDKVLLENKTQLDAANLAKAAQQKLAEERQAKLLELQKQLDITLIAKTSSEKALAEVKAQCDLLNKENEKNIALDKKLDQLLTEQKNHSNHLQRNLFTEMTRGLSNTAKQIESFMGVQNYLENGKSPLSFHGWPISPDIALFLLGKIEENNYDLIIEFGSGTSTVLFAKALLQKNKSTTLAPVQDINSVTFQKKIVTFEHNKNYFEQTLKNLEQQNLAHLVDLVHAPLVDYQYNEEDYLYYSCADKLKEISKSLNGRIAKILVLVDGPPGVTGPLARFPAIPYLFKYLGNHQLDIVLDDYNRKEEKDTAQKWKDLFTKRNVKFVEENIPCEKGAFFCSIN